jgi:cell division protein FtsL
MSKSKLKDIRLAYKISLVSAFLLLLINILSVIFVILPIYNLVGDTEIDKKNSTVNDNKLEKAENTTEILSVVSYGLIAISLGSGGYGVYQDVRKKPKKQK